LNIVKTVVPKKGPRVPEKLSRERKNQIRHP